MRPEVEITAEQLAVVEDLVDVLPWFSCGQLLLLKAMKQRQHPFFDTRLSFASLYATDRGQLRRYLQRESREANCAPPPTPFPSAPSLASDGFELISADELCEIVMEAQAAPQPPAERQAEVRPTSQPPVKKQVDANASRLISKFLAAKIPARIEPRAGVSAEDMAQKSAEISADLATETLADVYLSQGLAEEARQVYSKLSLVYPEKKAYFAARFASSRIQRAAVATL